MATGIRVLRTGSKPPGRTGSLCVSLAYSDTMNRRQEVGQRIKSARRAHGHKSARSFATSAGISETSIARAESGDKRVGTGVYLDIESALGWTPGSINDALDGASLDTLRRPDTGDTIHRRVVDESDAWEVQMMNLDALPEEQRWEAIFEHRKQQAAEQRPRRFGQTG